jgi:hypothetical protein
VVCARIPSFFQHLHLHHMLPKSILFLGCGR